jgi:hypothetical protein
MGGGISRVPTQGLAFELTKPSVVGSLPVIMKISTAKPLWFHGKKPVTLCKGEAEVASVQELHQVLTGRFDEEGLRTLCYYLEIDYDSLRGKGKAGKARELIACLDRRGQISKLVETGRQLRPDIAWSDTPEVTERTFEGKPEIALSGSGAIAIEGGVAAGAGAVAAGRDIYIHVEPLQLTDEESPVQFPPEHLSPRLEPIRQAIARVLQSAQPEEAKAYFRHVDRVIEYLAHFVGLLPPASQLSELEAFTLLAAAYLHDIGQYFPQPERSSVLVSRMAASEEPGPAQVSRLVCDCCHELSWEWIKDSLEDSIYPSLGLIPDDPVSEIALVCLGHRDANLGDDRYRSSGTGAHRIRPALLAALLSVADMLALASPKPRVEDLMQSEEPFEIQVSAWLRCYLERISIQAGHIRFHYQLPEKSYGTSVRVLLSGPIHLRLREIREILSENGLGIALDSSVASGPAHEMPPGVLAYAQGLAHQRLTSVIGALGRPSKPKNLYHFTGFRGRPTLRWSSVEGAERYRCQLFDLQQHLLARWETTALEITLSEDQVESGVQYEWITDAYRGNRRLPGWEGGIFWLVDEQMARWIDRQTAWSEALAPFERRLMQARILANYGLYEEASAVYRVVLEQGTEIAQLQARQELIALYEDISRRLNRLNKPSRSDQYLDAALTLARELQARIAQERLQVKKVCHPPRSADL